jgi:hypothetical protein
MTKGMTEGWKNLCFNDPGRNMKLSKYRFMTGTDLICSGVLISLSKCDTL